ncbi:uroporphyrinogen-III C-methyltransferase [Acidaminococcus fermentans DSM 20731]|uniref:uroporphyrinogen-III C-methyltransferase n=1 Tax=Acidaminococcus fermentans (strain ATCC 25085 / DSM 20731 / CCUG 9996 / CIP 106432 / VR4) TaxID=591001 RepID=D2RNT3_ACIFV|nr:uroporphyrinogen-III C-methyltransferase [Acidaminococcus fermentans]ADB46709.1 uroporphyrin-III C-methyltransferase [Acidaminococcus fermentans DSM 20731]UEA72690.1 uroporphyrinogen-III C-methyltransferase [Acidaminococcus fermentans DSM 20731]
MTENKGPAGEVWLVGAGCGRGLLTREGRETLARAHTVLYDALVPLDGLREINPRAEWLPVGKRSGRHSMDQESINGLLIRKAREGKMVVRLKGGDSFVFGRGGEEALALQAAGISWHVVPGVSSSIAVPEHFGIPVTHRGLARSFTVVTGHTRDGQEEDWQALARLQGTLVFLMGLERLETICRRLILEGKAPDTPASILCGGYTSQEIRLDGTLADLPEKARAQGAFAPAIILVGPVAGLGLRPAREDDPEKILVTGTPVFCGEVARALASVGKTVTELPILELEPLFQNIPEDFDRYGWLVFTSRNGVRLFFRWFRSARQDFRRLGQVRFACIGQGTAEELADQGFQADLMPEVFTAEDLGRLLGETLEAGDRCLLLRAEEGSPDLVRELDRAGRKYRDVPLYRIRTRKILTGAETRLAPQVMIFGSGRGVREFFRRFTLAPETRVLCIGPVTARAAREAGCSQVETAAIHSAAGIRDALEKKGSRP